MQYYNDFITKINLKIQPSSKPIKLYINQKVSIEALKIVRLLRFSDFFKSLGHLGEILA